MTGKGDSHKTESRATNGFIKVDVSHFEYHITPWIPAYTGMTGQGAMNDGPGDSHGRLWTGIDGMYVILDLIQNLHGRVPDTDTQD